MKHKNFLKKLTAGILGFVMTLGVGAAGYAASASETQAADSISISDVASSLGWSNGDTITDFTYGGYNFSCVKVSGSNPPKYYTSDTTLRFYNTCTMTVSKSGVSVTNVTCSPAASSGTTSGNSYVCTFTATVKVKTITITTSGGTTSSYTVTFDANGHGTAPSAATVSAGGTVTKPTDPTADGYTFGGWYTESGCTNEYNFSSAVNSSFTLYAKWTQNGGGGGGGTKTYQFITANGNTFGTSTSDSKALNTVNWKISTATNLGSYNSGNYAGQQLGTKTDSGAIQLETVNNWGEQSGTTWFGYKKVKKVYLWLNNGTGSVGTYDVKVDGTLCSKSGTVAKNSTAGSDYTQTSKVTYTPQAGHDTGKVNINVASSSKAIYFCAIEIECEEVAVAKYSVTNNSGNTVIFGGTTGANAAQNDTDYTAPITAATGYNQVSITSIVIGSTTLLSSDYTFSGGLLTIPKAKINGDITITAVGSKASYTVSASGTGVTFSSKPNATYLTEYQISFSVNEGYIAPTTATAKVGSTNITGVTVSGNTITVPAAGVTGNLTITADATLKTYTLSTSGLQNINFDQETGSSLEHGKTFAGTLTPVTGYTLDGATITVTMGDEDITSDVLADDYIQIDKVTGNIVITGSGVKVQDPVIDIDNDEFSIEENATATLTVEYSLATLTSASASLEDGVDVVTFGTLNPSTGKITLTPKAKGEGYYTLTVNYVNTNTSASDSENFDVYVEVYGDELIGISLSSESGNYYLGDNVVHPTVTAHYSLTGDRTVTASWDDSAYDKYHTGSYELIASYNGETATYTANVAAKSYTTKGEDTHVYTYDKVTSSQTDWRGKYLIVYETDSLAMDGSLETLDAVSNTKSVTISDNKIATDVDGLIGGNAIYFTVDYKGTSTSIYSLMSASGKYISGTTTSAKAGNGIKQADNPDNYEITFSGTELQSKSSDQQMAMKYNKANDQTRFRFYKSGQEAVALYKWTDHMTPGQDIPSDERHAIRIGNVSCSKSPLIAGDTLDISDFSIQVQFDTGNAFVDNLVPTGVSPTTIAVGAHDYTVSYTGGYTGETTVEKTISLTGQAAPVLDSIYVTKDNPCDDVFNRLDDFTHEGIHIIAHYTDSTTYPDVDVTESATITPPDMTTAGTKQVSVSYTEGGVTKDTSYSITVNAIHTTSLTLVMKDNSQNVISEGDDGFYEIQPGISYSLAFTGNGDYDSVSVTGGTTNTTVSNNTTLSSTATSNEEVTFTASCDQASLPIKVRVIASKTISLDVFSTENQGANAEVVDDTSGSFSGYIGNSVSIQIGTKNYSNPIIDDSELPSGLTLTGSFNSGVYSGTISATAAVSSGTYNLYVKESGGSDSQAISLTFSVVQDTISKIEITHEPNKVNYTLGETFDSTGLEVTAKYASGSSRVLNSNEYSFDPPAMTKGSHTVTVTLNGSTTIKDTFDITVSIPELNIVTEGKKTVPDPEHNVPGTTPIASDAAWSLLGKSDRVAKNSYLKNGTKFESYASSITVSFEGKALSSNKGSLFNFKLETTSNGDVVDKYTVYYAPINEDGTGYYKTTDDYEIISLTITGISESDKIDGYIFTACDKLNGATGSANGNLDHQNESATYKGFVPGTKEVPVYSNNVVTDEVYDFITKYGASDLTAENWTTIFTSSEYNAVVNAGKKGLFTNGVVSGTDDDGTKTSWKEFADFITKYDEIFATTDGLINYLGRTPVKAYTITIDYNHDGLEETVKVLPGEYELPSAPTYEGYVFQGWTVGGSIKQAGDPISVTGDMTITANWAEGITFTNSAEFNFTGLTMNRFQYVFEGTCPDDAKKSGFLVSTTGDANLLNSLTDEQILAGNNEGVTEKNKADNKLVIGTSDGSKTVSVMFYYVDANEKVVKSEVITMSFDSFVTADGFDPSIYEDPYAIMALQYYIAGLQAK